MNGSNSSPVGGYEPLTPENVRKQAQRYLTARYGENVWFHAPETFDNMLERWIWAVASNSGEIAEQSMAAIEDFLSSEEGGE